MIGKRFLAVIPGLLIGLYSLANSGSARISWFVVGLAVMAIGAGLVELQRRRQIEAERKAALELEAQKQAQQRNEIDSILRKY